MIEFLDEPFWRGLAARIVNAFEGYVENYGREVAVNEQREARLERESPLRESREERLRSDALRRQREPPAEE